MQAFYASTGVAIQSFVVSALPRLADERFRQLVESVLDYGITLIDPEGRIATWNAGAEQAFGYSAEEIVGQHFSCFYTPDDIAAGQPNSHLVKARSAQHLRDQGWRVRKDGSHFLANISISPIHDESAQFVGFAQVLRDSNGIPDGLVQPGTLGGLSSTNGYRFPSTPQTDGERMRLRVMEAEKDEAEKANRAKDDFLAMLSHELRTPLTPALAAASYLADHPANLPQDFREEVAMIRRNIQLEARLIDDLLDFTRLIRGKIELHFEVVDAHRLLREIVEVVGDDIIEKELDVKMSLNATAYLIWADPVRIRQVLWNLVRNAAKFTPPRGQIDIRTSNSGSGAFQLEVQDTGVGIDLQEQAEIFNAFRQESRSVTREFGGLGLGLTISKSLVELHHGTIAVESAGKNQGALFKVVLDTLRENAPSNENKACDSTEPKSLRLLLVEDHDETRRTLSRLLSRCGHKVSSTDHVEAALKLLDSKRFDAVVSDIGLPDRSGYELIALAKQRHPIKGIALSGFGMEEDIRRSFAAGFDHHLTKPVDFRNLRALLSEIAQ